MLVGPLLDGPRRSRWSTRAARSRMAAVSFGVACVGSAFSAASGESGAVELAGPDQSEHAKTSAAAGPIRMEAVSGEEKPPTYVMRGGPYGPAHLVFLHGMCAHALGYAQSFQFSAAKKGLLIAPQGDKACGQWASWSNELDRLDARIVSAFRSADPNDPVEEVVAIGYSQGAMRAEDLVRKWPARYTRLVLIASPRVSSARGFERIRSAVMMAGERDRKDLMKESARVLSQAGIPSTFMVIPEATHGAMGPTPEKTMGEALDWLFAHDRQAASATSGKSAP
jgi:predicted esterase